MRIDIAEVGLDPTLGYLHVCQPGRQALVYDLMEPYRPQVDREVLAFVRSQTFTPRDFVIDAKGVCRLHPELAAVVAARASHIRTNVEIQPILPERRASLRLPDSEEALLSQGSSRNVATGRLAPGLPADRADDLPTPWPATPRIE